MRVFAIGVLALHALVERSVGVLMGFFPEVFFPDAGVEMTELARSFDVGAGAIGLLSLVMLRWRVGEAGLIGPSTLAAYHGDILLEQLGYPPESRRWGGAPRAMAPCLNQSETPAFPMLRGGGHRHGAPHRGC